MSTAIQTKYKGIEYRSRLEARWAAFMSRIGWEFTYEPFDGDGYIPDFIVHGDRPLFIEVKPAMTLKEYFEPFNKVCEGLKYWDHTFLIVGASPIAYTFHNCAGILGYVLPENYLGTRDYITTLNARDESISWWGQCEECKLTTPIGLGYDITEICEHDRDKCRHISIQAIEKIWADACNDVKWKGTAL